MAKLEVFEAAIMIRPGFLVMGSVGVQKAFWIEIFEYSPSHHQVHFECRQNHEPCDKN